MNKRPIPLVIGNSQQQQQQLATPLQMHQNLHQNLHQSKHFLLQYPFYSHRLLWQSALEKPFQEEFGERTSYGV